jgi:hypothetical protein|nr:MAG TPA: hypothetical protein [Caudoviricetes sp.]
MENIRDIILGVRAERQEHMLKGFAPVPEDPEERVEKADNVFEKMAGAIEKAESGDSDVALQGEIEKSDIMNAISYDSNIKFGKLGKEIKAKLKADILPPLNAKLQVLTAEIESKLEDCGGAPTETVPSWWTAEIKMDFPFRIFSWQACDVCEGPKVAGSLIAGEEQENPVTPEMRKCRQEYNDKVREYANVATDIKACEILETNLSDNERYQLSPRQLTVFGF